MKRLLLLVLLSVAGSVAGQQDERARTEALAQKTSERLKSLTREADRLALEARTLLGELRRLELDRQIKDEQLRQAKADEERVVTDIGALSQELAQLEEREQAERPELRARLVQLYKLGQGGYLRLFLSGADARNLGQASRMVAAIARRDRERLAAHQRRVEELRTSRATLEQRRSELASLRAAAERAQAAAAQAVQKQNDLIRDIDRRRDLNAQLAGELTATSQRLQATLRELAAGGTNAAAAPLATASLPALRGELEWPAAGPVRHRFGRSAGGSPNGIEIATTVGIPVRAVHDGMVAFADTFAGYGKLVIVDHGAQTFTLYGHLLDIPVTRGTRVSQGDLVGSAGFALLGVPGLYFELRVDGRPVDPLQWLRKR